GLEYHTVRAGDQLGMPARDRGVVHLDVGSHAPSHDHAPIRPQVEALIAGETDKTVREHTGKLSALAALRLCGQREREQDGAGLRLGFAPFRRWIGVGDAAGPGLDPGAVALVDSGPVCAGGVVARLAP